MEQQEKEKILRSIKTFSLAKHMLGVMDEMPVQEKEKLAKEPKAGFVEIQLTDNLADLEQSLQELEGKIDFPVEEVIPFLSAVSGEALGEKDKQYVMGAREDCDEIIVRSNWQDLEFDIAERKSNLGLNIRGEKIVFDQPEVLADRLAEAQSLMIQTDLDGRVYMMVNWIDENAYKIDQGDEVWSL